MRILFYKNGNHQIIYVAYGKTSCSTLPLQDQKKSIFHASIWKCVPLRNRDWNHSRFVKRVKIWIANAVKVLQFVTHNRGTCDINKVWNIAGIFQHTQPAKHSNILRFLMLFVCGVLGLNETDFVCIACRTMITPHLYSLSCNSANKGQMM